MIRLTDYGMVHVTVQARYHEWVCSKCHKHFLVPEGIVAATCPYALLPYDATDWPEVLALYRNRVPDDVTAQPAESRAEFERDRFGTAGPTRPIAR